MIINYKDNNLILLIFLERLDKYDIKLLTDKLFVGEDDKVLVSFFLKQTKELKLVVEQYQYPSDPCQKLLLKYDQPMKKYMNIHIRNKINFNFHEVFLL